MFLVDYRSTYDFILLSLLISVAISVEKKSSCDTGSCFLPHIKAPSFETENIDFHLKGFCTRGNVSLGTCQSDGSDDPSQPTMFHKRCFCDAACSKFRDCCIDRVPTPEYYLDVNPWKCRKIRLPEMGIYHVHVYQLCPSDYSNQDIRTLCETETVDLKRKRKYFNYLQDIPVHGKNNGVMYRNVFCALCNGDTHLTKWKSHLLCKNLGNVERPQISNIMENAEYNPKRALFHISFANQVTECMLIVENLPNRDSLQKYGTRVCKPVVETCPPRADADQVFKCRSYTSYIYSLRNRLIYKNYHCALCNGVSANQTVCSDKWTTVLGNDGSAWLPLLFDFSFDWSGSNQVGQTSSCILGYGQVWDPVLKVCLNVTCGNSSEAVSGECISNISSARGSKTKVCRKVLLPTDYFVFTENGGVYVNHTEKSYVEGEYEVHMDGNSTNGILICEDELPLLALSHHQVWLSKITLGVSSACLILHLLTYSLLPKLRNRPGMVLMSLSATLLCGHLFFLLGQYLRSVSWLCFMNAILTYFSYLASFFWMSVMAFDIYLTFSSSTIRSSSSSKKIFIRYCMYAWLGAFAISLSAVLTDITASDSEYRPKFATGVCWFNQKFGLLIFFGVPVSFLLLANLTLFVMTAFNIRRVSRQAKSVNNFSNKLRYYLYIKLAVVFGLAWTFGFLAASLRVDALWYPFIILNGLQGALIFVFFTLKRKIFQMLVIKLKLRSEKYSFNKGHGVKKGFYSSLSNLTTIQTSLTSTIAPVASGSPEMLKAVRRLNTLDTEVNI